MDRLHIINLLAEKINAKTYLEIGVDKGYVINNVKCPTKIGVDPNKNSSATLYVSSDDFFATNTSMFDIIFIDGLHHSEQVTKDINNSLLVINKYGYIVCHDMNPKQEIIQRVPQQTGEWTGDCWKSWVKIRSERSDLNMYVVDTDYGCGIIQYGYQDLLKLNGDLDWNNFESNRKEWLNLISIDDFKQKLN